MHGSCFIVVFFFFQAEDGIRDLTVTGVQTCALPISCVRELPMLDAFSARQNQHGIQVIGLAVDKPEAVQRFLGRTPLRFPVALAVEGRSEEHTSELQSQSNLVCRLLLEKKKKKKKNNQ